MKNVVGAFCMVAFLVACGDDGSSTDSSQENAPVFEYGTLTDSRDGKVYTYSTDSIASMTDAPVKELPTFPSFKFQRKFNNIHNQMLFRWLQCL